MLRSFIIKILRNNHSSVGLNYPFIYYGWKLLLCLILDLFEAGNFQVRTRATRFVYSNMAKGSLYLFLFNSTKPRFPSHMITIQTMF